MRDIRLYGHLREKYGESFRLDVATAAEAVRALNANLKGFYDELSKGSYEVVRGDLETGFKLDVDDISQLKLGAGTLHFVPVIEGSKSGGGLLKSILGVALIGAAVFLSGGILAAPIGSLGLTYGNMAAVGLSLTLAGVSNLNSKSTDTKNKDSYTLSGPGNAYEQGNPVPLIYGEVITGSVMVSGGIDIEALPAT
jgi:predicted phage tail protein